MQPPALPAAYREERADADAPDKGLARSEELNLVWVQLRGDWRWLVVLAADPDLSTAGIARALADAGARLTGRPIDLMIAADMDLDRSSWLIGHLGSSAAEAWAPSSFASSTWTRPVTRTLVALESPVQNPLALPVALAADGVVLCVRRGVTPLSTIRKTVDAVGGDRIVCCVVLD